MDGICSSIDKFGTRQGFQTDDISICGNGVIFLASARGGAELWFITELPVISRGTLLCQQDGRIVRHAS
jgi:hypothetical protein